MSFIWPYATRDDGPNPPTSGSGQWRRVDQGQDLQAVVGTPILAIAAGTISYAYDPNGFGSPYPVLHLDTAYGRYPAVYYGHNHPQVAEGVHVNQGDVIAHALQTPGGNAVNLPGWLELGFWINGPACGGSNEGWTSCGQDMQNAIINAPTWEDSMPLSDADIQKLESGITTIVQQQIANACAPGGVIYQTVLGQDDSAANNVNVHVAKARDEILLAAGFKALNPELNPVTPTHQ